MNGTEKMKCQHRPSVLGNMAHYMYVDWGLGSFNKIQGEAQKPSVRQISIILNSDSCKAAPVESNIKNVELRMSRTSALQQCVVCKPAMLAIVHEVKLSKYSGVETKHFSLDWVKA